MAQIRDIGKRTALYERLSKDDEQQGESNRSEEHTSELQSQR